MMHIIIIIAESCCHYINKQDLLHLLTTVNICLFMVIHYAIFPRNTSPTNTRKVGLMLSLDACEKSKTLLWYQPYSIRDTDDLLEWQRL